MMFPTPSETFHSNNVRIMSDSGLDVSVYSMLWKHRCYNKLINERNLLKIKTNSLNLSNYLLGLFIAIINPKLLFKLISFIFKSLKNNPPIYYIKSLFLIPRTFYIFSKISKEKPDILHLLWGHYPILVAYLVKVSKLNISVSVGLLAYDLEMNYGCTKSFAPYADFAWTQCEYNVKNIKNIGFKNILVVYDGLDFNISIGHNLKVKHKIISIGRLIESKGMDIVVKAFKIIHDKYNDSALTILGEGPDRKRLEKLIESLRLNDSVFLKGHVSMNEVADELSSSDIFIFMSHKSSERLPNVLKEAMINRVICITSYTPGIEEIIENCVNGFIIYDNKVNSIFSLIEKIWSTDDIETTKIREKAYMTSLTKFNAESEIRKLLNKFMNSDIVV